MDIQTHYNQQIDAAYKKRKGIDTEALKKLCKDIHKAEHPSPLSELREAWKAFKKYQKKTLIYPEDYLTLENFMEWLQENL